MRIERFATNPLIAPAMLSGDDGANINGPSLIRAPAWLRNPLGKYYLYFAHHGGTYIRLAAADDLAGPWRLYAPGVMPLTQFPCFHHHLASPDVHVEDGRLRAYVHGPAEGGQNTAVAFSEDGLSWTSPQRILAPYYLRAFRHDGRWYGFAWGGEIVRSRDGIEPFASGGWFFDEAIGTKAGDTSETRRIRHLAIDKRADRLLVYFTCMGDTPERIKRCRVDLKGDWTQWKPTDPEEVLAAEADYEGGDLPIAASSQGAIHGTVHALRDPCIFTEDDRTWLFYAVGGESGIAGAEILAEA